MPLAKRSIDEIEERKAAKLEHTHDMNMRSLMFGMNSLAAQHKKRDAEADQTQKLTLNVGAFIRKATNRGADKTMSTYWTYKGSLTTPSEYAKGYVYAWRSLFNLRFKEEEV